MERPPPRAQDVETAGDAAVLKPSDLGIGLLFWAVHEAVIVADVETDRIVLWNPAAEAMFGYTADEAIGLPVEVVTPERLKPMHRAGIARYRETGHGKLVDSGKPLELPAVKKSGEEFFVELTLGHLGARPGGRGYVLAVIRDVSERKRAEDDARRREASFKTLAENSPDFIARWDRDQRHLYVNPAASTVMGLPPDAILGKTHAELGLPAELTAYLSDHIQRAFETGEVQSLEFEFPAGGARYFHTRLVPERDPGGAIEHVLGITQDVTARRRQEQLQAEKIAALEQADQLKDQFLSILSHELRTPLNAILGFASILEDAIPGPLNDEQHHDVRRILSSADTLLALVNDLLDMSRIQAGKFALAPAPCSFPHLARQALALVRPLAEQKRQHLLNEVPDQLPALEADEQRLEQVLMNLVNNAIKFTQPGGTIHVRARVEGGSLRCEVADTGPGIAHADQERLFKPFTQLDMSHTRPQGGTGLGLSIAKALVEAHGGTIGVESVPGVGATFWFTLPLAP